MTFFRIFATLGACATALFVVHAFKTGDAEYWGVAVYFGLASIHLAIYSNRK